jgi:hypothetical protein
MRAFHPPTQLHVDECAQHSCQALPSTAGTTLTLMADAPKNAARTVAISPPSTNDLRLSRSDMRPSSIAKTVMAPRFVATCGWRRQGGESPPVGQQAVAQAVSSIRTMARSSFGVISLSSCCSRSCLLRLAKACLITGFSNMCGAGRAELMRGSYHTHPIQRPRHGSSTKQSNQHGLYQPICAKAHAASSALLRHASRQAPTSLPYLGTTHAPVQHMKRTMLYQGNDSVEYLIASILFRAYLVSPPREFEAVPEEAAWSFERVAGVPAAFDMKLLSG